VYSLFPTKITEKVGRLNENGLFLKTLNNKLRYTSKQ
jgi:hypothetical protein